MAKPKALRASELPTMSVDALIPYALNSRTHSDAQVAQIAASIREFGFTNPVLVDGQGGIIAGHGRVLGARKLDMTEVPVLILDHLTPAQKRAYVIADNKLALNAGWDEEVLKVEIETLLEEDFDVALIGFDERELDTLLAGETLSINSENDGEGGSGVQSQLLIVDKVKIPMTEDEAAAMAALLADYTLERGSFYGFAAWLAERANANGAD